MKQFIYIIALCCCLSACKDKPNEAPKPVLPEGDFQVEATVSEGNKLTVAWSSPKGLEGGAAPSYTVYLGDKELGKTNENAISANISGNRFVNGRVITTDAAGRTRMKVFLIKGDGRDLVYIPDPVFEGYLTASHLDHDGQTNSQMSLEDAMLVEKVEYDITLEEDKPYIDNLVGVEAFSNLEILKYSNDKWLDRVFKEKETLADVSLNPNLRVLDLSGIKLSSMDVSRNSKLKELYCGINDLTGLDLSKHINLRVLSCGGNQLTSLDLSKNLNLEHLECWGNQLTSLDLSKNINLRYLNCSYNDLSSLDLSKHINLVNLNCRDNQLSSLDLSKHINLRDLSCGGNQLTSLDLSKNINLEYLYCWDNQLTSLDLSTNINLEYLDCQINPLTSLDLSTNINLEYLNCTNNRLSSLELSKHINLLNLYCGNNDLASLDLSMLINLVDLYCRDNQLTDLDLSKNAALGELECRDNPKLKTICVADVEKAKANKDWEKPETAAYEKCN